MSTVSLQQATISPEIPTLVIRPRSGVADLNLRELWDYRELFYFLAWRDIKVRYKQTVLGVAWAVIQPVFTMIVFTIFFGKLGGIPSNGLPYPIFTFVALLPWQLFSNALTNSSQSLVGEARLINKVYFPRLIIPISSIIAGLIDFSIAMALLVVLMFYYGIAPTANVIFVPAFIALALLSALSVGLWLSALNVRYRDVRYALPFLAQLWMFSSPVAYSSKMIPDRWQWVYGLNPMAGTIEGFRWAFLGSAPPQGTIVVSLVVAALLFIGGLYYFRNTERFFSDLV